MKDSRKGESLWLEWSGEGHDAVNSSLAVFYTKDHIDLENEVVKRALASVLQRDGLVYSLVDGFRKIENAETAIVTYGYVGTIDSSCEEHVCDEHGETQYGDAVDSVLPAVWVDIS